MAPEVLERVHRLISILSSQEDKDIDHEETLLTWFFSGVELKQLQNLVDNPPDRLRSDAMLALLRLRRLCEPPWVVSDESKNVYHNLPIEVLVQHAVEVARDPSPRRASLARVNSFLKDQTSPTRIARLKKIVNLLANAQPWDAGESTCTPSIVDRDTPSWNKETMTLTYKGKTNMFRKDAESVSEVFDWFQSADWHKVVKIKDYDIIIDVVHINNVTKRAREKANSLGFTITRDGETLEWADKSTLSDN